MLVVVVNYNKVNGYYSSNIVDLDAGTNDKKVLPSSIKMFYVANA